jgi:streptogramin lyase
VHLDLPDGRAPFAVSKSGERLWVLDDKNFIDTVDLGTGEMVTVMALPRSAQISQFVAGRDRLYALDSRRGDLYTITMSTHEVATYSQPFLKPVSSLAVGLDDRLWIGVSDASFLLRFDPKTKVTESFDLAGARVSRLTTDGFGTIYYADDARNAVGTLNPASGRITEFAFPRHGVTTALVVDRSSTLWLGNSAGEVWSVRGGTATLTVGLQRPVTSLVLDASGRAWYMAPAPSGSIGFAYATADGAQAGSTVGGPAFSLSFNALGRAWLADPRGGFFVSRSRP